MKGMKEMARPYGILFALALVIAVIGRIGLAIMDVSGVLAYDYISTSGVAVLDTICSILTGSALVAFMFAAGLALVVSTAGCALHGLLYARGTGAAGRPGAAFLWGWATALVAIVCLGVVGSGILSAVQVSSMSSKLPSTPVLVVVLVVFAAFLGTLLGAASQVVCACVARSRGERGAAAGSAADVRDDARADGADAVEAWRGLGGRLIASCAICGIVVMILTVGTFAAINTTSINAAVAGGWFAADVVANVVMLLVAAKLTNKATA